MAATTAELPPLESGDRLTREQFHDRYCRRPDIRRAELVNGVVYVTSPARWAKHSRQQSLMIWWLNAYATVTPGVEVGSDATIFLGPTSEVQPDAFLFRLTGPGAGATVREDGYIEGAPELVVEIAASSASYDLHDKMDAYRRAGVQEYVVWRVFDGRIDWFRLRGSVYVRLAAGPAGVIASEAFPGLRLDVPAMLAGDRAAVFATLIGESR